MRPAYLAGVLLLYTGGIVGHQETVELVDIAIRLFTHLSRIGSGIVLIIARRRGPRLFDASYKAMACW